MDFNDTPEEAAFRADVRAWLEARAERKSGRTRDVARAALDLERAREWQRAKAEAGFAKIAWPALWGGRDGTPVQQAIYAMEEEEFVVPENPFQIGLGMCLPTIIKHCDIAVADRFVPPAVRGDEIWCQLFSEPAAGSDLAGVRTRAEPRGEGWLVNGQKIWTSRAHLADFGLLLARSSWDVPKHRGLTMFWVRMDAPGIEVRPIRQMAGDSEFNEVFLTDVEVADDQRIGEAGQGWQVALTTLMHERFAVGTLDAAGGVADLVALAGQLRVAGGPATEDRHLRATLGQLYAREQGLRFARYRSLTALSRGGTPGPEASIGKLVSASQRQRIANLALDLMDAGGLDATAHGRVGTMFQHLYLWSPGPRIAGGTDEILRNIIAERVLGLPGEPRIDKDIPFNALGSETGR